MRRLEAPLRLRRVIPGGPQKHQIPDAQLRIQRILIPGLLLVHPGTPRLLRELHFSPALNGGSLPGGTVCSAIASIIATIT